MFWTECGNPHPCQIQDQLILKSLEEVEVGKGRVVRSRRIKRILIRNEARLFPVWRMRFNPLGERAVSVVGWVAGFILIAGKDHYESSSVREQRMHISVEYFVFDQVENDIE